MCVLLPPLSVVAATIHPRPNRFSPIMIVDNVQPKLSLPHALDVIVSFTLGSTRHAASAVTQRIMSLAQQQIIALGWVAR
jgi:hypothetical protein